MFQIFKLSKQIYGVEGLFIALKGKGSTDDQISPTWLSLGDGMQLEYVA